MRRFIAASVILSLAMSLTGCGGADGSTADSGALPDTQPGAQSSNVRAAIRSKIKHVFVLIQENHTFDEYFGLFPSMNANSVENLGTALAKATDCVPDPVAQHCQRPFLITANTSSPSYVPDAPDISGGDNGRMDQEASIDRGRMDGFLRDLEAGTPVLGPTPSPSQVEAHNEAIGIEGLYDCDTIPYLWKYASKFALFDHYFQGETGDSTPGNIQLFSGQIGQTEAAAGLGIPSEPQSGGGYSDGVPISNDDNPPTSQIPFISSGEYSGDNNTFQSYATVPLLLNPVMDAKAAERKVAFCGRLLGEGRKQQLVRSSAGRSDLHAQHERQHVLRWR